MAWPSGQNGLLRGFLRKCFLDIWLALECGAEVRSDGWVMSGKTYARPVFHSRGAGIPKTGQLEGCHT